MTRINTNVSSLVAQNNLAKSQTQLQTALTRLSTGLRINSGKDDPAGLIASEVLRSDIVSVQRAVTNSERANQLIATADSALGQVSSLLNDIRGLVSEAANTGALSSEQISANQLQVDSSLAAIDRISQTTTFQGRRLLDGSLDFISTSTPTITTNASGTLSSGTTDTNAALTLTGSAAAGGAVTFTALSAGTAFNSLKVEYITDSAGPTSATYDGSSKLLQVKLASGATAASVVAAVGANASAAADLSATVATAGAIFTANAANATTISGTATGGAFNNTLILSATAGGSTYNNANIVLTDALSAGATGSETATYSTSTNTLTVSKAANSTVSQIAAAINAEGTFSATTSGSALATLTAATTSAVTAGGANYGSSVSDLKINQANFGTSSSIAVQVDVDTQATQGTLTYSGGSLTSDLVLEVGGKSGFQVFNFGSGTTVSQVISAINQASDATGVVAEAGGSGLSLKSSEYGSAAFVSAKALSGSFATLNASSASATRTEGTDAVVRINGVQGTAKGLAVSLNTATLDLQFDLNSHLADSSTFSFSITGGGANFQLGPDVVSNQQARLGIQGVSTAILGGSSGKLYELRSGGAKDLSTDVNAAAAVVDEVISAVAGLRGRLGAFQKTTLETNIATLNDSLTNLSDAQSSIRDADFASESANLTRAQILVQSGTSVLQIANQNPQSVLKLLQ